MTASFGRVENPEASRYQLTTTKIPTADLYLYQQAARLTQQLIIHVPKDQAGVADGMLAMQIRGSEDAVDLFYQAVGVLRESLENPA